MASEIWFAWAWCLNETELFPVRDGQSDFSQPLFAHMCQLVKKLISNFTEIEELNEAFCCVSVQHMKHNPFRSDFQGLPFALSLNVYL